MSNKCIGIIPARFASTRFPGKMLALIDGTSLIERAWRSASQIPHLDLVIVATDDKRIAEEVRRFGGEVVITSDHPTGSDRIAEVARTHPACQDAEIIVNLQGDEPCLPAEAIERLVTALRNSDAPMATAVTALDPADLNERSVVKCVADQQGLALYFSRAAMACAKRHVGLYAFKRDFLLTYASLPQTPLQQAEDLEQLKALEHGYTIAVTEIAEVPVGVDTPQDIEKVEEWLRHQNTSSSQAESAQP